MVSMAFAYPSNVCGASIAFTAILSYTAAMDIEAQKRAAAARALDFVQGGMRVGLGTGSTAKHFVDLLGERMRGGLDVVAVPTSEATRAQAASRSPPSTRSPNSMSPSMAPMRSHRT
jgi:hypothetical protein